jgi:hypothetical protein
MLCDAFAMPGMFRPNVPSNINVEQVLHELFPIIYITV